MSLAEEAGKRKRAVALRYKAGEDAAPVIIAKGSGMIAEKIIEIAETYAIPLYKDPDLLEILSKIDLGHTIPPDLYKAVAEMLAFIYRVNGEYEE